MNEEIKLILLDIEGTISSIDFVHNQLFPYSLARIDSFVDRPESQQIVDKSLKSLNLSSPQQLKENLKQWIREDQKVSQLKVIQGHIWKQGFESGELQGHLYPEVPEVFNEWSKQGRTLAIYSSGSVAAQKLLLKHSIFGDLSASIEFHFDTSVGHKREVHSYQNICKELALEPSETLFLSDVEEELLAARQAKLNVAQILRADNLAGRPSSHKEIKVYRDLLEILSSH